METRADESQKWGPDASSNAALIILPDIAKAEKEKTDEMPPEIFLAPSRPKKRRAVAGNGKAARRKPVYHESLDFAGEGMDGNALGGTTLE